MRHDARALASVVSLATGLPFTAKSRNEKDDRQVISLVPDEQWGPKDVHTFSIDVSIEWHRIKASFTPGVFAGELLQAMSDTEESGRTAFKAIVGECEKRGAEVEVLLNGSIRRFDDVDIWNDEWSRFSLKLNKGSIEHANQKGIPDFEPVQQWTMRFAAAVLCLLPVEELEIEEVEGFPEGAVQDIKVNRYERDRRNRAAALAIHGSSCLACGLNFGKMYGPSADGYIHVHHVVPISRLGADYVVNPKKDLIPLCPNCHAVAHRRNPPFTVEEIKEFLVSSR